MFKNADSKFVAQPEKKPNRILWVEAAAFSLIIALSWLTEAFRLPYLVYGENFTRNWERALFRTIVIICIWTWVHLATRKLLARLHYLEEFLRVCSWCQKVCHEGEWLEMEKYLKSKFATKTSHGVCPTCLEKKKAEITSVKNTNSEFAV